MPEIKIKHVVSFSSEDKVHKAENIVRSETYRKWKCATSGEKTASIVLQFEKATKIHSIDIGNESSAFVEVLVGRSSDSVNDFQVLLVASSFMSPLESRNEQHPNRVRMFGPDKLSQNLKDEKWDCVQIVCTQPFNKNISYGLSFIKFHSPPEKDVEQPVEKEAKKVPLTLGAFKIKYDDEEEESPSTWRERKNQFSNGTPTLSKDSPSLASAVLTTASSSPTQQSINTKRKLDLEETDKSIKKAETIRQVNKEKVVFKDAFGGTKKADGTSLQNKTSNIRNTASTTKQSVVGNAPSSSHKHEKDKKKPFHKLMEKVVFVLSGFVNPLRGELRDKALEMGAKYKGDWDSSCTHLICAFLNTPKYQQVKNAGGIIVTKEWVIDCHKKRLLLPWRRYMLGKYSRESSGESSSEEKNITPVVSKKANPKMNGGPSNGAPTVAAPKKRSVFMVSDSSDEEEPKAKDDPLPAPKKRAVLKDDSETEDEDALKDYTADTDVDESGGDTEDEIRKCENREKKKLHQKSKSEDKEEGLTDSDSESVLPSKVDTSEMPLPDLPNLFKKKHFFMYGNFSPQVRHDLERYITAFNGLLEDYMSENVKYVITESKWDKNFEDALSENEDLIFVKPEWIFKCKESQKCLPYQPFIVIPGA